MPCVCLVAAVARNGVIGRGGGLVWREPLDQQHFRRTTMGCPVVMGRRTWESLPVRWRPLPGRPNVVVTRDRGWHAHGATAVGSLPEALARLAAHPRVCVIGGARLFASAMPLADELVLTEVDADIEGDTCFPAWDRKQFVERSRQAHRDGDGRPFAFVTYSRIRPSAEGGA